MLLRNSFNDVRNEIFEKMKDGNRESTQNPAICMYHRKWIFFKYSVASYTCKLIPGNHYTSKPFLTWQIENIDVVMSLHQPHSCTQNIFLDQIFL